MKHQYYLIKKAENNTVVDLRNHEEQKTSSKRKIMKIAQYLKICIVGTALIGSCYATDVHTNKAILSLSNPIVPEGIVIVQWERSDKPGDQIIMSVSTPSGFEQLASIYTVRSKGNAVKFQVPGTEIFEVSYKMYDGSILARVMVDCTKKMTMTDDTCKILDQNKTHK